MSRFLLVQNSTSLLVKKLLNVGYSDLDLEDLSILSYREKRVSKEESHRQSAVMNKPTALTAQQAS